MTRLVRVDVYPTTGFPDRIWGSSPEGPGSPIHDAFLRAARPVVERYSEALPALGLEGPYRFLRLSVVEPVSDSDAVHVTVWEKHRPGLPEIGFVTLNETVGRMDAPARARLVLSTVHAGLQQLAPARGWDPALLDTCHAHVVAHDHGYSWASEWRSSPGRRHQARGAYRLDGRDGFGRVRLEVRRRADEELVLTGPETVAFCTSTGLRRSAETLRWSTPDTVSLVPYVGLVPQHVHGNLTATAGPGCWAATTSDAVVVAAPGDGLAEDPDVPVPLVTASLG